MELPIPFNNEWTSILQQHKLKANFDKVDQKYKLNYRSVSSLLDTAITLMKTNKDNDAILNYAIKILCHKNMFFGAKEYFIDIVHHLVLIYPYLVFLLEYIFDNKFVKDEKKSRFLMIFII